MNLRLINFCDFYANFGASDLGSLDTLYSESVVFNDPVHQLVGIDAMRTYLANLCTELTACRFSFHHHIEDGDHVYLRWTMHYAHPRISGGKTLALDGATEIEFDGDLVRYHCDYYDMGAMLYERLPVIGSVIRRLRERLA